MAMGPVIRVKYFGYFRQLAGTKEESLDMEGTTVASLLEFLRKKHGEEFFRIVVSEGKIRDDVLVLLNQRSAREQDAISPGDEVAILPPVTGG